jgi:carbonic anhydrase
MAEEPDMDAERVRTRRLAMLLAVALGGAATCQQELRRDDPAPQRPADRNGAAKAATHAPKPRLKPLVAWQFVKLGNAAHVQQLAAAKRARAAAPHAADLPNDHAHDHAAAPQRNRPIRPAGAGRYVCAVLACADLDVELAAVLGVQRQDLLVLRAPGPFVSQEAVALLGRAVERHRLSFAIVLGHAPCESLRQPTGHEDALTRRLLPLRALARRRNQPLHETLVHQQRELLLASSPQLRAAVDEDRLRIAPALLDARTGKLRWVARRAHTLPIAPVK